jgi:hypothetical protein
MYEYAANAARQQGGPSSSPKGQTMRQVRTLFLLGALSVGCGAGKLDVGSNGMKDGAAGDSASQQDGLAPDLDSGSDAGPCTASSLPQVVIAEKDQFIEVFTFDGTDLYYATTSMTDQSTDDAIKRVSARGGAATVLAHAPYNSVTEMAAAGDFIYYAVEGSEGGNVYRLAKTGGAPVAVTNPPINPFGSMVGDTTGDLYFTTDTGDLGENAPQIIRLAPNGTERQLAGDIPQVVELAVDTENVYSTPVAMYPALMPDAGVTQPILNAVIYATPVAGGLPSKTVYGPFMNDILGALAVDDTSLYVCGQSSVFSVPKSGGGSPKVLGTGQPYPLEVQIDGDEVYWITEGYVNMGQLGSLVRVARGGGVIESLAEGLSLPTHFELGSCAIYWNSEVGPGGSQGTTLYSRSK